MTPAGYNSPQRMKSSNLLLVRLIALLLCLPSAYALDSWDAPCSELARQIAALTGPGTVTLTITNRSSISADDVPTIRRTLERNLRSLGIVVGAKDADTDVRVTLSQNTQGWLWVAEVREGAETKIAMLPVPGATSAGAANSAPSITLRANLLYAQTGQILDAAVLGSGSDQHLILLEPEHIKSYNVVGGSWQPAQSFDIAHSQSFPRDLRGRIVPASDHLFDAFLPGIVCGATKTGESWTMAVSCSESDDPWPLGSQRAFYSSTRNFFTGVVLPGFGPKISPFYAATDLPRPSGTPFLFVDISGAAHILENGSNKSVIGARDWGSDIVAVRADCGNGALVLASAAGWPSADSIRAYTVSGREASPASTPLTFEGIVTALWPANDPASATAIIQNLQQSRFEVYSVSVACSH